MIFGVYVMGMTSFLSAWTGIFFNYMFCRYRSNDLDAVLLFLKSSYLLYSGSCSFLPFVMSVAFKNNSLLHLFLLYTYRMYKKHGDCFVVCWAISVAYELCCQMCFLLTGLVLIRTWTLSSTCPRLLSSGARTRLFLSGRLFPGEQNLKVTPHCGKPDPNPNPL
jgi:hypothetical protein